MTTDPFIPQARVSLAVVPETFDHAEVRGRLSGITGKPVAHVGLPGLEMQTFQCDPADVAAALHRLADRIASVAPAAGQVSLSEARGIIAGRKQAESRFEAVQ